MFGMMLGAAKGLTNLGMMGMNVGFTGNLVGLAGKGLQRMGMTGAGRAVRRWGIGMQRMGKEYDKTFNKFLDAGPDLAGGHLKMPKWNKELGKIEMTPYRLTAGRAMNHVGNAAMTYDMINMGKNMMSQPKQPMPIEPQYGGYGDSSSFKQASQQHGVPLNVKQAAERDLAILLMLAEEAY